MIRVGDIDIDVADRDLVLQHIKHVPAAINRDGKWQKHNTGIYVSDIVENPLTGLSSLDYQEAEARDYIKIDILNNTIYRQVQDRKHLDQLLEQTPDWSRLNEQEFYQQIVHIGNHYNLYKKLREPITSLPHMAMFLALIRPAKRDLVGQTWAEITKTVWTKPSDGTYGFKQSHAFSYALLVSVHMNLLSQAQ